MELRQRACEALSIADPVAKAAAARALHVDCQSGAALDPQRVIAEPAGLPGRPARPALVDATALPRRSPFTPGGRAGLLHAVAHIEFNAIKIVYNKGGKRPLRFGVSYRKQTKTPEPSTLPR